MDQLDQFDFSSVAEKLGKKYEQLLNNLEHVNIVIAGKTGVGKSTLVNAVFNLQGGERAKTGIGSHMTERSEWYTVPDKPLRLYDTVGLELGTEQQETVKADILEQIRLNADTVDKAVHVIWYCISTTSSRIEKSEIEWISSLARCAVQYSSGYGNVKVIIVLTQSYIDFQDDAAKMHEIVKDNLPEVSDCIPVVAECRGANPQSGIEELVYATNRVLPDAVCQAFINAQMASMDLKIKAARKLVRNYAISAAGTGAAPIPFSDAPLLITAEISMMAHIAVTFGIDFEEKMLATLATTMLGVTAATATGKTIVSNILKMIPGAGTAVGAVISGSTALLITKALGEVFIQIMTMLCSGSITTKDMESDSFKEKIRQMLKRELKKSSKVEDAADGLA